MLASLGLLSRGAVLVDGRFAVTVGAILADDNGISLGDEVGFQILEHAIEALAAFAGPGHVVGVHPIPRIIGVNLDGDVALVAAGVGGNGKSVQHSGTMGGSIGRNNQVPVGVVATGGAHGLDKLGGMLVHVPEIGQIARLTPLLGRVEHLVIAFKQQMLVIVLEAGGNLCPQLGIAVELQRRTGDNPCGIVGSGVVVHIEDAIHALVDDIVHNLLHAVHPSLVNVALVIHVLVPGHGNADALETFLLESLHQVGVGDGLAPCGLISVGLLMVTNPVTVAVERIAQVPAGGHVDDSLGGRLVPVGGIGVGQHGLLGGKVQ